MTHALSSLLSALAWAAIAALFIARLDRFAHRWLSLKGPSVPETVDTTIPDDLAGLAMAESEKWAQDAVLETLRERFDKYHDWNKVRTAMGVAEVDG